MSHAAYRYVKSYSLNVEKITNCIFLYKVPIVSFRRM